ncbi:hypothetical protein D030_2079 [Vibrio parahaemolyticus AQ3810]|nr:hypothetical protein D030_2079 [Vibrio parahaemolyticus AQ3810]
MAWGVLTKDSHEVFNRFGSVGKSAMFQPTYGMAFHPYPVLLE